ncbi:MAG: rhodanese-like domain-containing protein [Planctomycetes bacterium]|nr:rhodanese-like domain-containing protein [Planctomycetota bacterium]
MPIQDLPPKHCYDLREADPAISHLDVRSPEEFAAGHPEGSFNVPIMFRTAGGMSENAEFLSVAKALCESRTERLILSCAMGGRSMRAAQALEAEGYSNLINMRGGFGGARGPDGTLTEQGWSGLGLPTSSEAGERSWDSLRAKA